LPKAPHLTDLNITDMTGRATCEQFVLIAGLMGFDHFVTMRFASTPPPLTLKLFVDFNIFYWPLQK